MAKTFKKLSVVKLSQNFREATKVVEEALRQPLDDEVLVKVLYSGVRVARSGACKPGTLYLHLILPPTLPPFSFI